MTCNSAIPHHKFMKLEMEETPPGKAYSLEENQKAGFSSLLIQSRDSIQIAEIKNYVLIAINQAIQL